MTNARWWTGIMLCATALLLLPGSRALARPDRHDHDQSDQGSDHGRGHGRDRRDDRGYYRRGDDHRDARRDDRRDDRSDFRREDDRRGDRDRFDDHDRYEVREWYLSRERRHDLPPGLARRDRLSPRLERELVVNGILPFGLRRDIRPCPEDLERRLPPPPEGYVNVIIGGHLVLMNRRSDRVMAIIHLELF